MKETALTPRQFAKVIGLGHNTVRRLIDAGELTVEDRRGPAARRPRYYIDAREAERWKQSRRMRITPQRAEKHRRHKVSVLEVIH